MKLILHSLPVFKCLQKKSILSQQLIFIGFLCSHDRQLKAEKGGTTQEQEKMISRMKNIYLIRMNNYNSSCKAAKTGKEITCSKIKGNYFQMPSQNSIFQHSFPSLMLFCNRVSQLLQYAGRKNSIPWLPSSSLSCVQKSFNFQHAAFNNSSLI